MPDIEAIYATTRQPSHEYRSANAHGGHWFAKQYGVHHALRMQNNFATWGLRHA